MVAALIALWLILGFLNYGTMLAYFQRQYPLLAKQNRTSDVMFCLTAIPLGVIGAIATLATGTFGHGFLLWPEGDN